jgi:hypothetical protein
LLLDWYVRYLVLFGRRKALGGILIISFFRFGIVSGTY